MEIFDETNMPFNFRLVGFMKRKNFVPEIAVDENGYYFVEYIPGDKTPTHYESLDAVMKAFDERFSEAKEEENRALEAEKKLAEAAKAVKDKKELYVAATNEGKFNDEVKKSAIGAVKIYNPNGDNKSFIAKAKTKKQPPLYFQFFLMEPTPPETQFHWSFGRDNFPTFDKVLEEINATIKTIVEAQEKEDEAIYKAVQATGKLYTYKDIKEWPNEVAVGIFKSKEGEGFDFIGRGKKGLLTVNNVKINPDGSCKWVEAVTTFDKITGNASFNIANKTASNIQEALASIEKYFKVAKVNEQQKIEELFSKSDLKRETDIGSAKRALQDKSQPAGSFRVVNAKDGEIFIVGKNDKSDEKENLEVFEVILGPQGLLISRDEGGQPFSTVKVKDLNELQEVLQRHLNFGSIPTKADIDRLAQEMRDKNQAEFDKMTQIMLMMDFDNSLSNGHFYNKLAVMEYPYGYVPRVDIKKLYDDYGLKNKALIVAAWKYILNKGGSIYIGSLSRYPGVIEYGIEIISEELRKQGVSAEALQRIHYIRPDIFTEPEEGPGEDLGKDPAVLHGMLNSNNPKISNAFIGDDSSNNITRAEATFPGINTVNITPSPEQEPIPGKTVASPVPLYYREFFEKFKAHAAGKEDAELKALREAIERDPQLQAFYKKYDEVQSYFKRNGDLTELEATESIKRNPDQVIFWTSSKYPLKNGYFSISIKGLGKEEVQHGIIRFDDKGFSLDDPTTLKGIPVGNKTFSTLEELTTFMKILVQYRNIGGGDAEDELEKKEKADLSIIVRKTRSGNLLDGFFGISIKVGAIVEHHSIRFDGKVFHSVAPFDETFRADALKDKKFESLDEIILFLKYPELFLKNPELLGIKDIDESYDAELALTNSDKAFLIRRTKVGDLKDGVFGISMKVNNSIMHATLFVDDAGFHFKTPNSSVWRGQNVKDLTFKSLKELTDFMQATPKTDLEVKGVKGAAPASSKGIVQSFVERIEHPKVPEVPGSKVGAGNTGPKVESKDGPNPHAVQPVAKTAQDAAGPTSPRVKTIVMDFESKKAHYKPLHGLAGTQAKQGPVPLSGPASQQGPAAPQTDPKSPKGPSKPGKSGSGDGESD